MEAQLNGVAFVRDYVGFHFKGPVLRSVKDLTVGRQVRAVAPQRSRGDALRVLTGASVQHVAVVKCVSIDIESGGDRRLRTPLGDDARVAPEAAHFLPDDWPDARMWVY